MKIDNYAVAMNAQYFNLQMQSTEAKLSSSTQNFNDDELKELEKISDNLAQLNTNEDELNRELSKAILANVHGESQKRDGDILTISTRYVEAQALNFGVKAYIQADGKEIELNLDVSLSRSFVQQTNLEFYRPKKLTDPLIISLDGTMPTLSSKTFRFDIDSDGKREQISQLQSGNGFLALDKNNNGQIDDGSELFGTKSGDGFKDLSKYDDDKNGWIDENDAIFDKLQIWKKSENKNELIALGEVGIGAIFLGNTQTPFHLKSDTNELLGQIKSSSFVLFESGKAGVISQVDLAVEKETKLDLEKFQDAKKGINLFSLSSLYTNDIQVDEKNSDDKMSKIQSKIATLEKKLFRSEETQKPVIQAQIGALYAQMMSMLEAQIL